MSGPIEAEYLGLVEGYHCYIGHRREPRAGRRRLVLVCQGYRAERVRDAPGDGEDVWFRTYGELCTTLRQLRVTP